MKQEDLLKIAQQVYFQTEIYLPFNSNRINDQFQPVHKIFWVNAMRAQKDPFNTRDRIHKWALNLEDDGLNVDLLDKKVHFGLFATTNTPTILELLVYLQGLEKNFQRTARKNNDPITGIEKIEHSAKSAVKFGMGNCREHSAVNFTLLLEFPKEGMPEVNIPKIDLNILIEFVYIDGGDHCFVLFNRDPNSDIKNPNTWGLDLTKIFIIDSWLEEKVLTLAEVLEELKTINSPITTTPSSIADMFLKYSQNFAVYAAAQLGQGHSAHWILKRQQHNEPVMLCDWPDYMNEDKEENVPWLDDRQDAENVYQANIIKFR